MAQRLVTVDEATGARAALAAATALGRSLSWDGFKPVWISGLDLTDVPVNAPATLAPGVNSGITAAGTYPAPPLLGALPTAPEITRRYAITNRTLNSITHTFPRASDGATVTLEILPGEVVTFRQPNLLGYTTESGNKPLAQLDLRYGHDLGVVLVSGAVAALVWSWLRADATAGAFAVTLPTAPRDKALIRVENVGTANSVTVNTGSGDTIEGSGTSHVVVLGAYAEYTYNATMAQWFRRRFTWEAMPGNARRDLAGRLQVTDPLALADAATLRVVRAHSDLEVSFRAADMTPGAANGQQVGTGQQVVGAGYTATTNDPAAYPQVIGSGSSAYVTSTAPAASSPLGTFAQLACRDALNHMRASWVIDPMTTAGGSTAGTADTGTVGLIAWETGFNGNGSSPNVYSPAHVSFNPTNFTYGVIYNPGSGVPTFAALVTRPYARTLEQDGVTTHAAEFTLDQTAVNDAGGRGLATVYAPDGTVHRISNNAIGIVPTATVAAFENYKSAAGQRITKFRSGGADSIRTDRALRARREAAAPRAGAYQLASGQPAICHRVYTLAAQTAATSGAARFHEHEIGDLGQLITGLGCQITTAQALGTGTLVKLAVYACDYLGWPLLTSAGLLGQVTVTATTARYNALSLASAVRGAPRSRVWSCYFYYQGTTAPTTAPLAMANNGSTTLPGVAATLASYRYLQVTGLTDLPVGGQALAPVTDAQGPVVQLIG